MSGKLFDRYGAILDEDVEVLEQVLDQLIHPGTVRVLEIGMHDGGTAKGIEAYLHAHGTRLEYWGIDPDDGKSRPRYIPENATIITGDSAEVFTQVPDGMHLVWVDGCHCFNHVVLDTLHYEGKVSNFGFMCFHDINPVGQGSEHQYHGPVIPEFGLAVVSALTAIHFPWGTWEFWMEKYPPETHNCGTRAYRKGHP